jgi:hypothetical protein
MAMVWLIRGLGGDPPDSQNNDGNTANVAVCVKSGLHTTLGSHQASKEAKKIGDSAFLAQNTETLHFSVQLERFGEAGKFFSDFSRLPISIPSSAR